MVASAGLDPLVFGQIGATNVRAIAAEHADDPRFAELWAQLFEPTYGPIRAAA
jgi:hypothetical protein